MKLAPQRWQDNAGDGVFDMILTFEERVFDLVVEGNQLTGGCNFCLQSTSGTNLWKPLGLHGFVGIH